MNRVLGIVSALLCATVYVSGCASGGGASQPGTPNGTAAEPARENVIVAEDAAPAERAGQPGVGRECRTGIAEFMLRRDGSVGILLEDGELYSIKNDVPKFIRKMSGNYADYSILPVGNVIVHWHPDRIMLEDTQSGMEYFKLAGDPSQHRIWHAQDGSEIALRDPSGRYNVWNVDKGFGGISASETVQDFVNRQSPDHRLRYPGTVRAMSLGSGGHIAVAIDDDKTGRVGLLYHLDTVNAPGSLTVMSRTNTPVSRIAISPSAEYVAAVDESGQFYFVGAAKKSFIVFARDYKNVRDVVFSGEDPVLVRTDGVTVLDHVNGMKLVDIRGSYDRCAPDADVIYCSGDGYLDVIGMSAGAVRRRYAFGNGKFAVVENGSVKGNMPDACH